MTSDLKFLKCEDLYCSIQNNGLPEMSLLQSSEPVNTYLTWQKDFADVVKVKD